MNKILVYVFVLFSIVSCNISQANINKELDYDYTSVDSIPIKLSITKEIKTPNEAVDGKSIELKVVQDVNYNGKIIAKKGEIVKATVEIFISKGMNGFPAEIIVDDYIFENIDSSKIIGIYKKAGANRCYWVFPLKWALTPIPFVGSLTNLILGGEAKLRPKDIITVYYYPEWK